MLQVAVVLIVLSGVIAILAGVFSLGFGGRILPGYTFKAKGCDAVKEEKYALRTVGYLLYNLAVFVCATGVLVYFKNTVAFCVLGGLFIIAVVFWALYFRTGKFASALKKAKELTE